MRKLYLLATFFSFLLAFYSCSDDYNYPYPVSKIVSNSSTQSMVLGDTLVLKSGVINPYEMSVKWYVNGQLAGTGSEYRFVPQQTGTYTLKLECQNVYAIRSSEATITVYGAYKYGTFILNEGNMTTENGSLIFISPKGVVSDSVYYKANGTSLGNVTQDLFIANDKIYIISQNGRTNAVGTGFSNDGLLVVANAETLKREVAYNDELSVLSWPTHVAVLGTDNIFLRDNRGVYLFNTTSGNLNFIKGTEGADKNRMAVAAGKVFVPDGNSVLVLEQNKDSIVASIDIGASVSGVLKSSDGNLWVSATGNPGRIDKVNSSDYSVMQSHNITAGGLSAGWGATPGISAKGDTIYFSNASTKIYRHIFSQNKTDFMVDAATLVPDANIVYNNLAVNPLTGDVYLNTIKGYGWSFLQNNISVFNFDKGGSYLKANYRNYTHFPAGIFFTYSFN